jgi:hypothetical protein
MNLLTPVRTLDMELLKLVKQGFVPMPGGQTEPVAGASPMTAAMGAPMGDDPAAMGGMPMNPAAMGTGGGMPPMDPAAMGGGMPMDPAAMGAGGGAPPPMDPAAMGGMPMDPAAMAGAMGGSMTPDGNISMPVSQLIQLITVLRGADVEQAKNKGAGGEGGAGAGGEAKPKKPNSSQLLQEIHAAVTGQPAPAAGGGAAPAGGGSSGGAAAAPAM